MTVRYQKTAKGEVAILPRKEYEALTAKSAEADEDAGTARLVARARKEVAEGIPLFRWTVPGASWPAINRRNVRLR